jgi:hypothetical protein
MSRLLSATRLFEAETGASPVKEVEVQCFELEMKHQQDIFETINVSFTTNYYYCL